MLYRSAVLMPIIEHRKKWRKCKRNVKVQISITNSSEFGVGGGRVSVDIGGHIWLYKSCSRQYSQWLEYGEI